VNFSVIASIALASVTARALLLWALAALEDPALWCEEPSPMVASVLPQDRGWSGRR
jgi:hypothetical protein